MYVHILSQAKSKTLKKMALCEPEPEDLHQQGVQQQHHGVLPQGLGTLSRKSHCDRGLSYT